MHRQGSLPNTFKERNNMAKILYKKIKIPYLVENELIIISETIDENEEFLTLGITPSEFTHVSIGEKRYKLKAGTVEINTNEIPNGISEIAFITGTKKIYASPLFKEDRSFGRAPIDQGTALAVERTLTAINKTILDVSERVSVLEEIIKPKNMFNFN